MYLTLQTDLVLFIASVTVVAKLILQLNEFEGNVSMQAI